MKANQINLIRRKWLAILLAITLIMCCIALFAAPYNTYAFTDDNINNAKYVGDILLDDYATRNDGKVFNAETLKALYTQITGVEGATLDTVGDMIDNAGTYGGQNIWNASNIRNANKAINDNVGKDIILTMVDGMQWIVTSLVKVSNDEGGNDIVATLWRADSAIKNASTGEAEPYTHVWNSWYDTPTNTTYPSNVYGTSYIRAEGLNIGGGYVASQGASSLTDINQSEEHPYAKFTMDNVQGSLTGFLVRPSAVDYQGVENQNSGGTIGSIGYTLANEAYGTPTGSTNWYKSGTSIDMSTMPSKAGYTDWKEDLIWLPSVTETGYNSTYYGIWGLSDNQRSNSINSWLRSGYNTSGARTAADLTAAGSAYSHYLTITERAVRPALHLNLSAAGSGSAKTLSNPADFEVTYDGSSHDITDAGWYNNNKDIYGDSSKMSVTYSQASPTNFGEYTVTLTIKDNQLTWTDAQSSTDKTRTCKMTIKKAEPNITPVIGSYSLYPGDGLDKFPSISLPDSAPSGSISWDSGQTATTTKTYNWSFTSSDNNYTDKKGSTTLTVTALDITAIEAGFTPSGTIYTSTSLDSLKGGLTVTKKYNNGTSAGTAGQSEYSLSGSLNAGTSTITVTLIKDGQPTNITTTFEVNVTQVILTSMTASLNSGGNIYITTPLNAIKSMLTVSGVNNDGNTTTIASDDYSISCGAAGSDGTLPSGSQVLTLTLNGDSSITCNVTVQVNTPDVASITVEKLPDFPETIFSTAGLNTLKQYLKVVATFADADNTTKEIEGKDYTISGTLVAGRENTLVITYGGKSRTISVSGVIAVEVTKIEAIYNGSTLFSSASVDNIKGCLIVTATYNNDTDDVLAADGYEVELPEGGLSSTNNTVTIKCGDKTATVTLDITDVASTGIEVEYTDGGDITVNSALADLLSGIKLTLKYNDGSSEVIAATADMLSGSMDSIGDKTITITYTDPEDSTIKHTATFTVNVGKGNYDMSNVKFEDKTVTYNGQAHSIEISGDLPEGVSVSYEGNGQIEVNEEGYIVTAKFTHSNPNYNAIPDKTAKLIISDKPVYDMSGVAFEDVTDAVYDGEEHSIELSGELPDGVTYVYVYDEEESATPFKFKDAGTYEIIIKFTGDEYHAPISDKRATLTISAADFDTSTLNFVGQEVAYDGEEHSISIDNLPEWLEVEYEGNGVSDMGKHSVTVKFTHSNSNYKAIPNMTVTLTIGKGKLAKPVYKGDIRYSGESILPDVSDFEGYIEGVIEIVIDKSEAGVFVGKYTIVFAIVDTERYEWEEGDTKSIVRINKISVNGNAILALADEISLEENEIAVEWSIEKAKLTATKKDGALPVFSSTSYKGSMDEVITYKYYTDKECTEEIAKEEIVAGQTYYVKASLEDSDNFELDATAIKFVGTSFSYDAPAGELSTGEKIVEFLKKNWLWLVIALVALLILIIIIVLIARRKKDDNNGKGNNNPPYPPYNGGQPPYPPYNGGQPPYPPYGQQPPYGGQPPYYDRMRAPIMPMAGMIQPQMQGSMQPTINGAMQPQIGMQQQMQAQLQSNQMQAIQQPQQVKYVENATPALNAPSHVETHISDSGVNILAEEVHRLRGEVEHIRIKSEEERSKLRTEVENARTMSAVESAKMQAMAEIERAKNEAKFAMHSGNISEAAATTVNSKAGAGDVLGDALMSAVAKMIVQGSINGGNAATASVPQATQPIQNNASTNAQNNANAIPQCPPGGRMTTTTMVDMTKNSRQTQFSPDDSFM